MAVMNGGTYRLSLAFRDDVASDRRSMLADFKRIDNLTAAENEQDSYSTEITKRHWKPSDGATRCQTRACRKQFTLLERRHHCRRCGDIFCASCLTYRRKLNRLAHLDPQGRLYKVCKACYEEGQSYDGHVRDLTAEFAQHRDQKVTISNPKGRPRRGGGWRNRLNYDLECQRLVEGFRRSVGKSEVRLTLHELRSMVSMPDWQKSSLWLQESTAGACQICREGFGLLSKRHFCKVCGLVLCKTCSTLDLLVYIPDNQLNKQSSGSVDTSGVDPCLAIIKIIGCPEVEPEVSLHLRVCTECREELVRRQVERLNEDEAPSGIDMMNELAPLHTQFSKAESNVNQQLKDYQEIVESLADNSRRSSVASSPGGTTSGSMPQSNMRTLAKAQEDLTDFLANHVMLVQRLKRLVPKSDPQSRLLKHFIRAKCDYYLENMSTFRRMKNKLAESSPPEMLEYIQRTMDKHSIVSTHLYLRQLVYEMLHLCDKYELKEKTLQLLLKVEQVIEKDVESCLQREGEDFEQHLHLMKDMICAQMKNHPLIRPSRRALAKSGKAHVQEILTRRTHEVIDQVTLQLELKSANRSFPATKQALGEVKDMLAAG